MYPVRKIMHMLNFLDTFSMDVTLDMNMLERHACRFHNLLQSNLILYIEMK